MNRYQWILFDADGTLFDYEQAEANALQGAFADFSLPFGPQSAAAYQVINHQIWLDFEAGRISSLALRVARFERLFESLHIAADPQAFSACYLLHLSQQSGLMPGAQQVVAKLAANHRMAIITNGLSDVQRPRLALSTIHSYFAGVFISEEMGVSKPDPAYFEAVFSGLGAPLPARERVLVVGDSLTSDIQGGLNYGLDTCWFNPAHKAPNPHIPATYEIHQLDDLLRLTEAS